MILYNLLVERMIQYNPDAVYHNVNMISKSDLLFNHKGFKNFI